MINIKILSHKFSVLRILPVRRRKVSCERRSTCGFYRASAQMFVKFSAAPWNRHLLQTLTAKKVYELCKKKGS
jgi:hypothetical protein